MLLPSRVFRCSPSTSRSWRRRAFRITSWWCTSCWTSSWTSVSHRRRTARSFRSKTRPLHAIVTPKLFSSHVCFSLRYITQKGNKLEVAKTKVPTTVTNAVSWRSEGIRYKKNEVFIDVIESINVLVCDASSSGCLWRV